MDGTGLTIRDWMLPFNYQRDAVCVTQQHPVVILHALPPAELLCRAHHAAVCVYTSWRNFSAPGQ
jgi:hypothetical protein